MTDAATIDAQKRAAACAAVDEIKAGMIIGLGTGSTAAHAIAALGERVAAGLAVRAVATSARTAAAAGEAGVIVVDMADIAVLDLAIDGVDEIDPAFRAIKGAGGAMLREKVVATAATRMIAIADASKQVARLGARPVPVETLPFARALVERQVHGLGGVPALRRAASGAVWTTDQGANVLDCMFGAMADPAKLASALSAIPGVLGHGLFIDEIDALYIGGASGVHRSERAKNPLGATHP